ETPPATPPDGDDVPAGGETPEPPDAGTAATPTDAGRVAAPPADGGTPDDAAASRDARIPADAAAVVRRVGCDPITRGQVDGQLRLLAAWEGRALDPGEIPDDDPLRDGALEVLIDQRIVEREARVRGLGVEVWEVQQAAAMLAQRMGGELAQMYGMFQQLGVAMADVERALEAQVLAYKVALAIAEERGVHATDEQIAAEYATRTAGLDPSMVRPLEEASEGLRQELEFKLRLEAGRAWVAEQREALGRLRTTTRGGRCVELPAEEPPAS
ncbi:MAG: hypothetical protein JXB32_15710, partial [Deltaproteobacteria bacterium]|nr:hypothetical protein [Deltaproteobacteria bacterium]